MNAPDLLAASRREETLYRELVAVYETLATALGDEVVAVDPARVAAGYARAETVTDRLRQVAATLAPHRLSAATVPAAVGELWRTSAALAATVADLNAGLVARARARRAAVATRLASLAGARQGLGAYRPLGRRPAALDQHA